MTCFGIRSTRAPATAWLLAAALLASPAWPVMAARAGEPAPAAESARDATKAEPGKPLTMEQLRERLVSRVSAVRESQARAQVLQIPVKSSSSAERLHAKAEATSGGSAGAHARTLAQPAAAAAPDEHAGHAGPAHWDYAGDGGPAAWASLKPEFATCGSGQRQSPIDIRDGIKVDLEGIRFDYQPSGFSVIDNGHTVQVNVAPGNSIEVGGRRYDLVQFHFHRPSEERINGKQFDLVAHLVHKDPQGHLAVIAVLMNQGRQHPLVQMVWNNLPLEKNEAAPAAAPLDMNLLLPEDRRYYTYMGSLTTPPCSEGVLWMVFKNPAQLSSDQLAIFSRLYPMNARPIQQVSGRMIKESN